MKNTNYLLECLDKEKITEIELYIQDILNREYKIFNSPEDINNNLEEYTTKYLEKINYEEQTELRSYTGISFRKINSILRNTWNYELNGELTNELKNEYIKQASNIRNIILKNDNLPMDIKVYRGVSLSSFKSYGINNINDLLKLQNQYMYEEGFTSTSLLEEESFFNKQTDWGEQSNIEIEYLIPNESDDGVLLTTEELSYSPNQEEYLINNESLFKVINVEINELTNTAKIQMVLIPQKVWSPYDYELEHNIESTIKQV